MTPPPPDDPLAAFDISGPDAARLHPYTIPWRADPRLVLYINGLLVGTTNRFDDVIALPFLHGIWHSCQERGEGERARVVGGMIRARSTEDEWALFVETHGQAHALEHSTQEETP